MNSPKDRLARIALLDRCFGLLTDDELRTLLAALPEEERASVENAGAAPGRPAADHSLQGVRALAAKGRMNGNLERLGTALSAGCLGDCIEALGDHADLPSEEELAGVIHGLVERHGLGTTRVMFAAAAAGDAPAGAAIVRLLKHDPIIGLPAVVPADITRPAVPAAADPERAALRERRKEKLRKEQAAAALRREQMARAKRGR